MIRRKRTNALYRQRNLVGRFFNELKQFRRIATRYDKLGADFRAFDLPPESWTVLSWKILV